MRGMTRPLTYSRLLLVAFTAVALVAACCLGAGSGAVGAGNRSGVAGESLLALHGSPFSAVMGGVVAKVRVLRAAEAALVGCSAVLGGGHLSAAPLTVLTGGTTAKPFSLRLRI